MQTAGRLVGWAALSGIAVSITSGLRQDPFAPDLYLKGVGLSNASASKLEATLKKNPKDLTSRSLLAAYYTRRRHTDSLARSAFRRHLLWLISNRPEAPILATVNHLDRASDPAGYEAARRAWLSQTKRHGKEPVVLGHAARFFWLTDPTTAEKLLRQAEVVDAKNPRWPEQLGDLYSLGLSDRLGAAKRTAAAKSLAAFERSLKIHSNPIDRSSVLSEAARVAVDAGALEKARSYAEEVLQKADFGFPIGVDGNSVHYGNLVLGRVALREGDLKKAGHYLIESGKTKGSPNLNSFGPNMLLAKELLEKGEREPVIEYFRLCERFWDRNQLKTWTAEVKAGKLPDFGANLDY